MDLESFRETRGWTLERVAEELGLASKAYLSDLQGGRQDWPLELALRMQLLSEGAVLARDLVPADKRALLDQLAAAPEAVSA